MWLALSLKQYSIQNNVDKQRRTLQNDVRLRRSRLFVRLQSPAALLGLQLI